MCAKKRRVADNNFIHILISNLIIKAFPSQKFSIVSAKNWSISERFRGLTLDNFPEIENFRELSFFIHVSYDFLEIFGKSQNCRHCSVLGI